MIMKKKSEPGSSFATPTKQTQNQAPNLLKQQFIYELLGQEETFKKFKNKQNLTKLIQLYRRLVQHYSQKNDKIALYFIDKISSVSAEMPSLQSSDQKVTMSMAKQQLQNQQNSPDSRMKYIRTQSSVNYDPQVKKKERSKNAQIAIQVSKVKKKTNARTILNSYYEECIQNNKIVEQDLKKQRKQLEEKLIGIHKKSLQVSSKPIIL